MASKTLTVTELIIAEAQRQGLDPALALEVSQVESGMSQAKVSPKGAIGVFQLMPSTAAQLGVNPYDLQDNIRGGVMYLLQMLGKFGDPSAALAAYNWGPGNVSSAIAQYGSDFSVSVPGQPTIPAWLASAPAETRNYVATILANISSQYSAVAAYAAASSGATPGGGTSTMTIPGIPAQPPPTGFSWGTVALVAGIIFGIGLVLNEA